MRNSGRTETILHLPGTSHLNKTAAYTVKLFLLSVWQAGNYYLHLKIC